MGISVHENAWAELIDSFSVKGMKKSEHIDFLKIYSFNVPELELRQNALRKFTKNLDSYDGVMCRRSWQYIIGVVVSTSTQLELAKLAKELKIAINYIYSHHRDKEFLFLDYVLSKDWGKFIEIIEHKDDVNIENIKTVLDSKYFKRSDEFACLILKLYGSEDGRKLLSNLRLDNITDPHLFELFDTIKGKSGGLLREVYFSIRREVIVSSPSPGNERELILYLQLACLEDVTAFSTIMIAIRCMNYDIYELFNELEMIQPSVANMMLASVGLPYLVWSDMQQSLILNKLNKNHSDSIKATTLNDFYEKLLKGYANQKPSVNEITSKFKVGVIITTFKPNIQLLKNSLSSILYQSHKNLSVCIIDDCNSNEVSQKILDLVEEINDNRVILEKNEQNVGQYISRNKAMTIMNDCDYFAIQDDDDVSHFQRVEHQLKNLIQLNGQLCMCQQVRFDNSMRYIADKINPFEYDFSPASSMFRADLIDAIGGFANVRSRGDVEFITRIRGNKGSNSIVNLAAPLYIMRCDLNTVSASKDKYLKTQLDVFRAMMSSKNQHNYLDGQQHALFS